MSKRYIFPQQSNDRKRPKLDVTISDHNFPLSQNLSSTKEKNQADNWGDENDDEILLLASQACEEAYISHDISTLPDYSMCMQPASTSTQVAPPRSSTSKGNFMFKKPSPGSTNAVSLQLKDKFQRISSPLPGITPKIVSNMTENVNLTDDLIFNNKIYQGQDSEHVYRQMLQLQEENAKLKSENGKLLEKCVTKEGEASILRTQLKASQITVDNARLDKLRAQEKVQMDWTEKLNTANNQMQDLRTQLDFKNLEIISIKEKCKMLESNKVKLTQVMVSGNDISYNYNNHKNNNFPQLSQSLTQAKRVKVSTRSIQTENKTYFIKLNKVCRAASSHLKEIIPLILQPTTEQQFSILEHSDKLQKSSEFSQNKCRIFSTFHRLPCTPISREKCREKLCIGSLYEDVTYVSTASVKGIEDCVQEKCLNIFKIVSSSLNEVITQLGEVSRRMTTSFQREMDEKYIEHTSTFFVISRNDLLSGKLLYKEEEAVLARRMTAVLAHLIDNIKDSQLVIKLLDYQEERIEASSDSRRDILYLVCRICSLLDSTSCTILYSSVLLSIISVLENILETTDKSTLHTRLLQIVQTIITSRPLPIVSTEMLILLRKLATPGPFVNKLCSGNTIGNLKTDYDQGVLLYRKESCYLQIYLKEIEAALKCIERQCLIEQAARTTNHLLAFYSNICTEISSRDKSRCDCKLVMSQVIVYALQICAVMFKCYSNLTISKTGLLPICRSGILILYQWVMQDIEFSSQLGYSEGLYYIFVEICDELKDKIVTNEIQGNMLLELVGTLQTTAEDLDMPSSVHQQVFIDSFNSFVIEE